MQVASAISRSFPVRAAIAVFTVLPAFAAAGCFTDTDGLDPPKSQLYYPTNLVVSPGGKALYVTNSDFDIQYNGGTVQVLDLTTLRETAVALREDLHAATQEALKAIAEGKEPDTRATEAVCARVNNHGAPLAKNPEAILYPGPCSPLDLEPFVKESRTIGAFASGAVLVHRNEEGKSGARLFVSVRGDPSVTYFDVTDDRPDADLAATCEDGSPFCLECAAVGEPGSAAAPRCGSAHRIGEDPGESQRGLTLPIEPVGIAASGDAIVTAHQTEGSASLVLNRWDTKPSLEYYITNLPVGPTEVAALPVPGFVAASLAGGTKTDGCKEEGDSGIAWQPGFLITFREESELNLLRYYDDCGASPRRPFLSRSNIAGISVNPLGNDSRGVAIDASERQACEAACEGGVGEAAGALDCMRACARTPLRFFVASRAPSSLLIGEINTKIVEQEGAPMSAFEEIVVRDTVPLAFGASRVAIGRVIGEDGELHLRVFALAFDSRLVFVYDPEARRIETVIRTGRGPHAIAFDTVGGTEPHSFLYIGHFTDSYIGVVDLDMRRPSTFGSMFLTVGRPVPPRESK